MVSLPGACSHVPAARCPQASRTSFDNLNKRFIKEMYDLAAEQNAVRNGLNSARIDFAWNVGLTVRHTLTAMMANEGGTSTAIFLFDHPTNQ